MIRATFLFLSLTSFILIKAQLKSPEQFLGYKPGSHFTPHWRVISYFQQVESNASTMVKLQQYGETNEGRPLTVAFVSTPENIHNLENIRKNNLQLANQSLDNADSHREAPIENTPVSYTHLRAHETPE